MDFALIIDGASVSILGVLGLGVAVGIVAGMFGVGGGFLLVPGLHVVLGIPLPIAIGTALCQTIATGTGSFLRYRRMGFAEMRFDIVLIGGGLIGVDAGTRLLEMFEGLGTIEVFGKELAVLRLVISGAYLVLFTVLALLLWFRNDDRKDSARPAPFARVRMGPRFDLPVAEVRDVSGPLISFIGLFNGVLAGLLGIGGGILLIPIMLYGFGFDIRRVAGTGIVVVLVVAILGTIQHSLRGNVHLGLAMVLMMGSALAAQVGAGLTRTLSPVILRRGLALTMVIANGALVSKLLR